ncbi:MAG: DUF4142 domain-containing protein [Pyrinomonadaceae bacterium]
MRTTLMILSVCVAGALFAGCATSTNTTANANNTNASTGTVTRDAANANASRAAGGSLSEDDREFMAEAAEGGMLEVELGRLAAQKAQSPEVKRFGQQMVDDHTKAGAELKQLAAAKGVTLPAAMNEDQRETVGDLSKLSGKEFDKDYVEEMVDDHEKDVSAFESAARSNDAELKAFAAKTLPTLQGHLKMIREIKDQM